jgi:peroxiredoxin
LFVALAALLPVIFVVVVLSLRQLAARSTIVGVHLSVMDRVAEARSDGRVAPPFKLPSLEGSGMIDLRDFAGKVVVLNFWASWCAPCRVEAPHLQAGWQAYRLREVQFLGVDHQDQRAAALGFQQQYRITYPSVFDPAGKLAARYGLLGIPTTLIIGRDGRIAYRFLGKVDGPTLRAALEDVLERQAP